MLTEKKERAEKDPPPSPADSEVAQPLAFSSENRLPWPSCLGQEQAEHENHGHADSRGWLPDQSRHGTAYAGHGCACNIDAVAMGHKRQARAEEPQGMMDADRQRAGRQAESAARQGGCSPDEVAQIGTGGGAVGARLGRDGPLQVQAVGPRARGPPAGCGPSAAA